MLSISGSAIDTAAEVNFMLVREGDEECGLRTSRINGVGEGAF